MDLSTADAEKWRPLFEMPREPATLRSAPDYEQVVAIRQRQRRLTPEEIERVMERYRAGATVYDLAAEFRCNRVKISDRLKAAGVTMRLQAATPERVDEMVRLYESGLSLVKVGGHVGVSARTVLKYLRERGVPTRDTHGRRR